MYNLSHEVLLALAYVSQISDPDSVRSRFIESLNGLDEAFVFRFCDRLPPGVLEYRALPIATLRSSFGYVVTADGAEMSEDDRAVLRTAFVFLAVILENRVYTRTLESKSEELLREIKQEKSTVRTVLDTLPVGVWFTDENGTILMGNAAGARIWAGIRYVGVERYSEYKAWWSGTGRRVEPEEWAVVQAIKTGETLIDQEIDIECFNGTRKAILNSAAPLLDDRGGVIGAVCVNQDITDLKLAGEQIKVALREKEVLLKEIQHRVKNNLLTISGVLAHQLERVKDPESKDVFITSLNRINAMTKIHTRLYQSEDYSLIHFRGYIEELLGELSRSYGFPQENLTMDIEDIAIDINTAIPAGLTVNELVSNAIKHAFPDGRNGQITITLSSEDSRITLTVSDNGIGFPPRMDFAKTESVGLSLLVQLVEQINGTMELIRENGSRFIITFSID